MSVKQIFNTSAELDYPTVLPTLDLDFANSKTLDPRITFTRASGGSYVGADGLIKYAGVNEARFDHNPVTGESLGLLVEESRSNLLLRSEEFDDASWTKFNSSINSNVITAPDNTSNATKLIQNTSNNQHMVIINLTSAVNTTYTFSFFAKSAENQYVIASFSGGGLSSDCKVVVSLIDGSVTTTSNSPENTSVTKLPNGWYRITLTKTTPSASAFQPRIVIGRTGGISQVYQGDGTSGVYIWGAQLEEGAFPTSYIPTEGSTRTCAADDASITGKNFSDWYRQDEGTVFVSSIENGGTNSSPFWFKDGNFSLRGIAYRRLTSTNNLEFIYRKDSSIFRELVVDNLLKYNTISKIAVSFNSNKSSLSINGNTTSSSYSDSIDLDIDSFTIGRSAVRGNTPRIWVGTISKITYYPYPLKDSNLQSLTS